MKVKVRTMRKKGRSLHKGELDMSLPPHEGLLQLKGAQDHTLHRHVMRARLLDTSKGTEHDVLPSLTDASVIYAENGMMTLIGTERVDGVEYGQTWAAELA
jgi:hypothetical protein